mgnify:CR=1 FL=1|tara:strand:+ start:36602 stop:37210 length:609 start_codon:yes stop_codon:yes gene_type:complete
MKNKVLLIGNGPSIDRIDFTRISQNVITVGTNRAWMKLIPNYLFFNDPKIFQELDNCPRELEQLKKHTKIVSSDWLEKQCVRNRIAMPDYIELYPRPNKKKFPDCVTTAIDILERNTFSKKDTTFYISGVSLAWKTPSHFWKKNRIEGIGNDADKKWYDSRFSRILNNFRVLQTRGFNVVSVTPNSRINKYFPYEHISNLYR